MVNKVLLLEIQTILIGLGIKSTNVERKGTTIYFTDFNTKREYWIDVNLRNTKNTTRPSEE